MEVNSISYFASGSARQFANCLKSDGAVVIETHPISINLIHEVFSEWQRFYSSDKKNGYLYSKKTHAGYFPLEFAEKAKGFAARDCKEYFQYIANSELPHSVRECTTHFFQALNQMAGHLLFWLQQSLPEKEANRLPCPLQEMALNSSTTMLRSIHYPPLDPRENPAAVMRAAPHEDINLMTLLIDSHQSGFQLRDAKGNWQDIDTKYGSIVAYTGEMLELCTNGYFKAATHRVINPHQGMLNCSRFSFSLFIHPHNDINLKSNVTAGELLAQRRVENAVV